MTTPPNVQNLVQKWINNAEEDYASAQHLLTLIPDTPWNVICFHTQQVVEKYLKALLASRQIEIPRTHDIETLVQLITDAEKLGLQNFEIFDLSEYAVDTRYPSLDESSPIEPSEARKAVEVAGSVRKSIRAVLLS